MSVARGAGRASDDTPELDVDALALLDEHRSDPLIMRFIELCDRTTRAEKISHPGEWTPEEQAAYRSDDWVAFSRLRGYTNEEIADFRAYLKLAADLATKYRIDTVCAIAYLVQGQNETS